VIPDQVVPEDDLLTRAVGAFGGQISLSPNDYLFPETEDRTLSIWDDVDWWSGEEKGAPQPLRAEFDRRTNTPAEARSTAQTVTEQSIGGAGAFRAVEEAQKPVVMTTGSFVKRMLAREGDEYEWGGTSKKTGFDCSGIIYKIMQNAGVNIPRTSGEIIEYAKPISVAKAIKTPGAVLWHEGHIAVSLGNGQTIEAMGEDYGVVRGEAGNGRFTRGGLLPETIPGKAKRQPHRIPRKPTVVAPQQGRKVGAQDLTDTVPLSSSGGFTDALLSLVHEDVEVQTPKGKRALNLADVPKLKSPAEIVSYARRVAKAYGWNDEQFAAINQIVEAESGWDPQADNPTSTASGIPQRLLSAHPFTQGEAKKWKDPRYQVRWLMSYINQRYDGDPLVALRFREANGYY
jgi:cell wall-associated NlpC family hydrolase